jgi:hypothetical protein
MSFPFDAAVLVRDPLMGRCLEAARDLSPGDALWIESAYVFAANEEDDEGIEQDRRLWSALSGAGSSRSSSTSKNKKKKGKKKPGIPGARAEELTNALADLDSVAALDIARCLLQLVGRALRAPGSALDNATALFLQLEPSNVDNCMADISDFRVGWPDAFPAALSTEFIARLLGVLNNNQMELEDIVGAGLFVASAVLEHSCIPNCSYSTSNSVLYMVATEAIKRGERLSIDYGNNYCRPTFFRRIYLQKTYKFFCVCKGCQGPDISRCFVCPSCHSGSVCALYSDDEEAIRAGVAAAAESGEDPDSIFEAGFSGLSACAACRETPSADFSDLAAREEASIVESGIVLKPLGCGEDCNALSEEVDRILHKGDGDEDRVLQDSHYLVFWAKDRIAEYCSEAAGTGYSGCSYADALDRAVEVGRLLEICLPSLHHEKVVYNDKLGQLAVAKGDIAAASAYFAKACSMSSLVCGLDNPSTIKLSLLATNTPTDVATLLTHYNQAVALEEVDDDDWEDA